MSGKRNSGPPPGPPKHPQCRCTTIPVLRSWAELGFDLDELPETTRASMDGQVPAKLDFESWLKTQPEAVVREALGPRRMELWKQGQPIGDFVTRDLRPATLKQIALQGRREVPPGALGASPAVQALRDQLLQAPEALPKVQGLQDAIGRASTIPRGSVSAVDDLYSALSSPQPNVSVAEGLLGRIKATLAQQGWLPSNPEALVEQRGSAPEVPDDLLDDIRGMAGIERGQDSRPPHRESIVEALRSRLGGEVTVYGSPGAEDGLETAEDTTATAFYTSLEDAMSSAEFGSADEVQAYRISVDDITGVVERERTMGAVNMIQARFTGERPPVPTQKIDPDLAPKVATRQQLDEVETAIRALRERRDTKVRQLQEAGAPLTAMPDVESMGYGDHLLTEQEFVDRYFDSAVSGNRLQLRDDGTYFRSSSATVSRDLPAVDKFSTGVFGQHFDMLPRAGITRQQVESAMRDFYWSQRKRLGNFVQQGSVGARLAKVAEEGGSLDFLFERGAPLAPIGKELTRARLDELLAKRPPGQRGEQTPSRRMSDEQKEIFEQAALLWSRYGEDVGEVVYGKPFDFRKVVERAQREMEQAGLFEPFTQREQIQNLAALHGRTPQRAYRAEAYRNRVAWKLPVRDPGDTPEGWLYVGEGELIEEQWLDMTGPQASPEKLSFSDLKGVPKELTPAPETTGRVYFDQRRGVAWLRRGNEVLNLTKATSGDWVTPIFKDEVKDTPFKQQERMKALAEFQSDPDLLRVWERVVKAADGGPGVHARTMADALQIIAEQEDVERKRLFVRKRLQEAAEQGIETFREFENKILDAWDEQAAEGNKAGQRGPSLAFSDFLRGMTGEGTRQEADDAVMMSRFKELVRELNQRSNIAISDETAAELVDQWINASEGKAGGRYSDASDWMSDEADGMVDLLTLLPNKSALSEGMRSLHIGNVNADRAFADPSSGQIGIPTGYRSDKKELRRAYWHEIGHHVEFNDPVLRLRNFAWRNAQAEDPAKPAETGMSYDSSERKIRSAERLTDVPAEYMLRVYPETYTGTGLAAEEVRLRDAVNDTEVQSMLMESLAPGHTSLSKRVRQAPAALAMLWASLRGY